VTDLTHDGADEGFHEIQLSGKQLVFLFMATTVVSVVIFLCGVLVGRGVKGDTVNAAESNPATQTSSAAAPAETPTPIDPPAATSTGLTYSERLNTPKPIQEDLKPTPAEARPPAEAKAADAPVKPATDAVVPPATTKPAQAPAPAPTGTSSAPAPQAGRPGIWAVQVVALSDRGAANSVVQRLTGKGYPAFVLLPAANAVQHYKVQVGRYTDRSEAEQIRLRLKKEEQFEPIIVR
jgi:DedD protein